MSDRSSRWIIALLGLLMWFTFVLCAPKEIVSIVCYAISGGTVGFCLSKIALGK